MTVTRTDGDGVTVLRLDRPESRNALTTGMLEELRDHLRAVEDDQAARAVLLVGAGSSFCAGADLREFEADAPAAARQRRIRLVTEVLGRLLQCEHPTVAAVQGAALGAGWGLALACDVCFASADASFALPEVAKGLRVPQALLRRLVQVVGPIRAAELAYGGSPYDANAALAAGCCTRVLVDVEELHAEARGLCTALAAQPRESVLSVRNPLRALAPTVPFPPPELTWIEE